MPSSWWEAVRTSHRKWPCSQGRGTQSHGRDIGSVIGIALVLSAVFVPTALIPGITGRLYQQFAVTIAISVILSAFNALTLSPALAALLLKPKTESRGPLRKAFDWFNRMFGHATEGYVRWSGALIRKSGVAVVMLLVFGIAAFFFSNKVPSSFLPDEDQGYLYVNLQLPNASSLQRTVSRPRSRVSSHRPLALGAPPLLLASAC
jgi:HAE1 family hydrophobic/amphiphilic exporter-1